MTPYYRGEDTHSGEPGFCKACEQHVPKGPDICLGTLPGVSHACCGHGDESRAYVVLGGTPSQSFETLDDYRKLEGPDAVKLFKLLAVAEKPDSDAATVTPWFL
jgi:hypothetical protein